MTLRAFLVVAIAAAILYVASTTSAQNAASASNEGGASVDLSTSDATAARSTSDAGSPSATSVSDAGVAADAATDAGTDRPLLPLSPEEADFAKARAERETALVTATAARDAAEQRLASMKILKAEFAKLVRASPGPTDAGPDARAPSARDAAADASDGLTVEMTSVVKDAIRLYSDFNVSGDSLSVLGARAAFEDAVAKLTADVAAKRRAVDEVKAATQALEKEIADLKTTSKSLRTRLHAARIARCKTAYCFGGDGTEYAFEPMLELPIGVSFAVGEGALARFSNGSDFSIQFTAGIRFWMLHDYVSLALYFAKPVYTGNETLTVEGSSVAHSTADIRRLGPSFGLGLFGDILFVGAGYDQLRNGNGEGRDPAYAPNQVLSRAVTFSVGIAPFTAIRNVAGGASK